MNDNLLKRAWKLLSTPSSRFSLGALLIAGGIGGVIFWGGFNTALEVTNTEKFCISCHEMRDNVYAEFKGTIHDSNRTGVRATCPDCHVPHELGPKLIAKAKASTEVWGSMTGKIDTKEKFAQHRYEMARRQWLLMKETDSRECRNCHEFQHMDHEKQERVSARRHEKAFKQGGTCIDCHKGIAHHLPQGYEEEQEASAGT